MLEMRRELKSRLSSGTIFTHSSPKTNDLILPPNSTSMTRGQQARGSQGHAIGVRMRLGVIRPGRTRAKLTPTGPARRAADYYRV